MLFNADTFTSLLTAKNPTLGRFASSDMQPVINLLKRGCDKSQLQKEINKLPAEKVEKYQDAMQAMANARGVHYFGLKNNDLTARFQGTYKVTFANVHNPQYTSKDFHATARVLCITPSGVKFRVGFVQICNAREQVYSFHGTTRTNGWRITAPFPIGDSAGASDVPFYVDETRLATNCTQLTTRKTQSTGQPEFLTMELDDGFSDKGVWRYAEVSHGVNEAGNKPLRQIKRDQSFTAWVAAEILPRTEYELLRQIDYRFNFQFNFDNAANTTYRTVDQATGPTIKSVPPGTRLPAAALNGVSMNSVDQFFYS